MLHKTSRENISNVSAALLKNNNEKKNRLKSHGNTLLTLTLTLTLMVSSLIIFVNEMVDLNNDFFSSWRRCGKQDYLLGLSLL